MSSTVDFQWLSLFNFPVFDDVAAVIIRRNPGCPFPGGQDPCDDEDDRSRAIGSSITPPL